MNAYVYQAALYCEECAHEIGMVCHVEHHKPKGTNLCDSECTPIGPYADGGGESDTPSHCDSCHVFLENPLTEYGEGWVQDALRYKDGDPEVMTEWRAFYDYLFE